MFLMILSVVATASQPLSMGGRIYLNDNGWEAIATTDYDWNTDNKIRFSSSSGQDVSEIHKKADVERMSAFQVNSSGQELYHHSYTDDLAFMGTDRWGVNFIIDDMFSFPPADSVNVNFIVDFINVFSPQPVSDVTISLHANAVPQHDVIVTQPGVVLFTMETYLHTGWNSIALTSETPIKNGWIVVGFAGQNTDIPVSASLGGGAHSYFFDRFSPTAGTFRNMRNNGFQADLLFHLVGRFDRDILMIDILDFSVPTFISFTEPFFPSFNIRNNSTLSAKNVYINLSMNNPNAGFSYSETIQVSSEMSAGQIISSEMINFQGVILPQSFAQYQLSIQTGCDREDNLFLGQTVSGYTNVFEHQRDKVLLEVFTLSADSFNERLLSHLENETDSEKLDVLFYFANSIDNLHTWGAYQRHIQYQQQGFQQTYFNGYLRNRNFVDPDFFSKFQENYLLSLSDKTFIKSTGFEAFIEDDVNLFIDIHFINENTNLLSITQNDFILNAAFVQPFTLFDKEIKMLTQYITNGAFGITLNLTPTGETNTDIYLAFPIYNISLLPGNDFNDLEIVVWINRRATKEVYFHEIHSLKDVEFPEHIDPNNPPSPQIRLYPNPVGIGDVLNIDFINSKEQRDINVTVYNIRGQRVVSRNIPEPSFSIDSLNLKVSGVYFMKVSWTENGKEQNLIRRLTLVK